MPTYVADWPIDDQPFLMDVGGKRLVSLPYSTQLNDTPAFEDLRVTADEFETMIRRQFYVLYREFANFGSVMALVLHPYITGMPHRIDSLDAALAYVCRHTMSGWQPGQKSSRPIWPRARRSEKRTGQRRLLAPPALQAGPYFFSSLFASARMLAS